MSMSWRRKTIGSAAIVVLVAGSAVASLPASAGARAVQARPSAAKVTGLSFDPAIQTILSNTHKKLQVRLFASESIESTGSATSAGVTVSRNGVPETHNWNFSLTNGTLTFNPATGKGSLKTKKELLPYAMATLSLKATGKKQTTKCGTQKTIDQPVKVSGTFWFDTRSGKHGWGKVTSKHLSGKTFVIYEIGKPGTCGGGFVFPCGAGLDWDVFHSQTGTINQTSFSGSIVKVGKKTLRTIFASRNTQLSKPKNASRGDETEVADNNQVFKVSKAGLATLTVKGVGPLSGSATLSSSLPGETGSPESCGKSGHTETSTDWQVAYTNGKSPLEVHEQIEGAYKVPNIGSDSFENSIDKTVVN
jgi:hypothetical protein